MSTPKISAARTYGLTHIALAVKDLDRTLDFYQQVFDVEVMYRQDDFLQVRTPGSNDIIVFEKKINAPFGETGGLAHFGFRLKDAHDIHEMVNRIINAGGAIKDKGEFAPGSPYVYFKDPDGYEIEIWYELLG